MKSDHTPEFKGSPAFQDFQIKLAQEFARLYAEIDKKNLTIKALTEERDEVVRMANKLDTKPAKPDIVDRLWLTPVLICPDKLGQSKIDYEACKKYVNEEGVKLMREAADEIERLRKERDEARREVCNNEANHLPTMADPRREAKKRGWDCFKEDPDD
jgi:hypothetical protein